jgi:carbon storage regulator
MLVLSRKPGERLVIGDDVVLVINKIAGNRVTIAIEAPREVRVVRGELAPLSSDAESRQPQSASSAQSQLAKAAGGSTAPLSDAHVSLAGRQAS